jgi:phosphatidylglycerol---prolipoprotein diacylglyceryl transferase
MVPDLPLPAGLLAGIGIVAAVDYALRRVSASRLDPAVAFTAAIAGTLGGLFGGHALFVAVHGAAGTGDWLRFWGDQSVFGVLVGGGIAAAIYLRVQRASILRYADAAAPAVALGYAVARLGCFLHGDDFGAVTAGPWGVRYAAGTEPWQAHVSTGWITADTAASLPVVPVQLMLALAALGIFFVVRRVRLQPGGSFGLAALLYGIARFALEPLRADFTAVAGPLSLPQLFACLLAAAGAALLLAAYRRTEPVERAPVAARPGVEALR